MRILYAGIFFHYDLLQEFVFCFEVTLEALGYATLIGLCITPGDMKSNSMRKEVSDY